ncbi:hypothetical protein ACIG0A_10455 [Streptomyces californicus]|uniref:hypothetical protein n=1 Tax=Streptomyces californicus TaxID=67351 RepID=UPI0037D0641C
MNQCTAVALLPPPAYAVALADPGRSPEAGHVLCELGEGHAEDHAAMLWDQDGWPGSAVWVRWDAGDARLAPLPWCSVLDHRDADAACGLFVGHPAAHDWEVVDPTGAAITEELARLHPHLFR